jgi:Cellulase (glycosyl hydrolase family 5)
MRLPRRILAPLTCLIALSCLLALFAHPRAQSLAAAPAHSNAAPARSKLLGGINIPDLESGSTSAQADTAIARAHALHAQVVRIEIPWSVLEPLGPGQIDPAALAFTDRLASDATAAGIRVIMMVDSTPCWASTAPVTLLARCTPGHTRGANSWPPKDPADYASIVAFLAARYGGALAAIEVWNEPDQSNQFYFAGPEKATRYAALLRAAYPAIKQANAAVPVLGGSLVGSNGSFLRQLYAAGIKGYYDGLSVHFYNLTLGSLRSIHEVQLANGDRTPLWLNEFGWSSCYPQVRIQQEQACVTPQLQATNLTNTFRELARTPYVTAAVDYKLQSSPGEDFGVLDAYQRAKPSFAALALVLASPLGSPSPITLTLRSSNKRLVASGSGPVGDYMQLEASNPKHLVYRALFTLDRFNRYSLKLPKALGTKSVKVRVYQYWLGAARAAKRSS